MANGDKKGARGGRECKWVRELDREKRGTEWEGDGSPDGAARGPVRGDGRDLHLCPRELAPTIKA